MPPSHVASACTVLPGEKFPPVCLLDLLLMFATFLRLLLLQDHNSLMQPRPLPLNIRLLHCRLLLLRRGLLTARSTLLLQVLKPRLRYTDESNVQECHWLHVPYYAV